VAGYDEARKDRASTGHGSFALFVARQSHNNMKQRNRENNINNNSDDTIES
jgi:hypothetical protein